MIVDSDTFNISPTADEILFHFGQGPTAEVEFEKSTWSNELVRHVLEFKINKPASRLDSLVPVFDEQIQIANSWLNKHQRCLLPTGMHPWMNPQMETQLWPFEGHEIYEAFDRVFKCQGHGWSNLQSVHLNLPYGSEEEFVHLHAAIRLLIPIIPVLTASSPFQEGQFLGHLDQRLESYRTNSRRFQCITGQVVPEIFESWKDYHDKVFTPIATSLRPLDDDGIFEAEWVNARGAIARLSRGSIEIRVIDTQECPLADLAILQLVVDGLKFILRTNQARMDKVVNYPQAFLVELFQRSIQGAKEPELIDPHYCELLGLRDNRKVTAHMFWQKVFECSVEKTSIFHQPLMMILDQGSLAKRILSYTGKTPTKAKLLEMYQGLANCLQSNTLLKQTSR